MLTPLRPKRRPAPLRALLAAFVLSAGAATAALALASARLSVGDRTVSTDVRLIGGRPYVPLADMARAMNGTLVRHASGYEIKTGGATGGDTTTPTDDAAAPDAVTPDAAGGANEVKGVRGKIGQMLFTGKWRFEVLGVDRAAAYDSKYLADARNIAPAGDTEELVIVRCRLKNGQKTTQMAMLSPIHPHNIALTDAQGQSYAPTDFDKRGGSTDEGPHLLPGAQTNFAVLFSVPKGTALKDLVFSLQNAYEDFPDGGTDVRVSLAP